MQNYFELFDLETSFFIDDDQLKAAYRREISRFHPDNYATKSESEKLQALQNTSLLNTAFTSLKTPLNRASYLLKMQGLDPFDERDTVMNHDFLMSQIDLREELEVIEEDRDSLGLEDFLERVDLHIEENTESIYKAFELNSDHMDIKMYVRELKFYDQLYKEANKLMDELL
ncbi:MAG: Fe-S protein assembly co-chaperone HscB [Gammaproteobacteria bacterium]|jgi:molecular chaperone HscB|nr:Fe-S protein assembly co-chaperone HscB [Gammaproteobacteria bacterium]MBT5979402.1 Fe-S protein assembly co-chaperone HscB [Gammaproteobacteria bacterium]